MQAVRDTFYERYRTCAMDMPYDGGVPVWIVSEHTPLHDALVETLKRFGVENLKPGDVEEWAEHLDLSCPSCNSSLREITDEVGTAFTDGGADEDD